MNKVKPKAGQIWESTTLSKHRIKLLKDSPILAGFHERYSFIPQTDLEWLAVKYDNWTTHEDLTYIARGKVKDGDEAIYTSMPGVPGINTPLWYTKQQWQDMRHELVLDESKKETKPLNFNLSAMKNSGVTMSEYLEAINTIKYSVNVPGINLNDWEEVSNKAIEKMEKLSEDKNKTLDRGLKSMPVISDYPGELHNETMDKFRSARDNESEVFQDAYKEIAAKPSDIYLPEEWLKEKGIELVDGDKRVTGTGMYDMEKSVFITSFVYRKSAGVQPLPPWLPVDHILGSGLSIDGGQDADSMSWGDPSLQTTINKWKPNAEELYKIYLSEQEKKVSDILDSVVNKKCHETLNKYQKIDLEKIEELNNFLSSNGIGEAGQHCIDVAIKDISENHDIDIRSNEDIAIDHMWNAYSKSGNMTDVLSEIKKGYVCDIKWVGE